jgi:hypothetical protein
MPIADSIITFLSGGLIGYFIKYYLDLQFIKRSEAITKKREVYEEIAKALGVFISGRNSNIIDKNRFLEYFSKIWLWASDPVVRTANEFSDIMIGLKGSNKQEQEKAKLAFSNFVLEMRKELGFPKTKLKPDEYRFVSFGN